MILQTLLDFFLHIDKNLVLLVDNYGLLIYLILFLVIFCETGLVVAPLLPGDSLLFAAGGLAAIGSMNILVLFLLLLLAAILGDTVNYWIGHYLGPRVFKEKSRFFKQEYLLSTQNFYEEHGGKTIIFARFIPIIRTFAPFVAGIGSMNYSRFILFNIVGGLLWVVLFLFGGYFFSQIPFIENNFSWFILGIIFVSILPLIIGWLRRVMKP